MPKVSVIIPSYNTASLIGEALDSVFAQEYRDFEVIVVNDGSPDTLELERVLQPYRDRIIYLKQENKRACGARNNGIRHAQGDYVAFLDSDDSWMPAYLRRQMLQFDADPSLDMVYCDCRIIGPGPLAGKTHMQICPSAGPANFESVLVERCQAPISGTVVKRAAILKAGLFDERLAMCDDYEMWLRLAYHGARIAYYSEVLANVRIGRPNSLSTSNLRMLMALITILSNVRAEWKLNSDERSMLDRKLQQAQALADLESGKESLKNGNFAQARALFEQANGHLGRGKLRITLLGLRIAPAFTALLARSWDRLRSSSV